MKIQSGQLQILIQNPYEISAEPRNGTQTGLANVRKRLEQIYHGKAIFTVKQSDGLFTVHIMIPIHEIQNAVT
jgi:LytS/YehU family sensor histidine kinase